ncbi:MAG: hypothetical protein KC656_07290 [Myxococcales bacterium]|nr:hypothetical protein [Myxococcales bacterium]MCB9671141.1 amidase [Alphaproteobacteria bacterium]MCB9691681.1 amidase [Alphaproteobacteria bacterium]
MRRALRAIGVIVGSLVVLVLLLLAWGGQAVRDFPWMPSSYEAKEYCSCRWTSGRDDAFCDAFVHQTVVPTQGRTVDEAGRAVTARALWVSTTARWAGEREGCVLVR